MAIKCFDGISILKWSARGEENRHLVVQVEMLFGTAFSTNTRHWPKNVPSPHRLDGYTKSSIEVHSSAKGTVKKAR
jgi:hypothetical protein